MKKGQCTLGRMGVSRLVGTAQGWSRGEGEGSACAVSLLPWVQRARGVTS